MQNSGYAIFAECEKLGRDASQIPAFIEFLNRTLRSYSQIVFADKHVIRCPNFRRAFRMPEYENYLRGLIEKQRITAVMFDGFVKDGKFDRHFTFAEFQRKWHGKFPALWGPDVNELYAQDSDLSRRELMFFDSRFQKILADSGDRDARFVDRLFEYMDIPVLQRGFGEYHGAFKEIAQKVYDDGVKEGIIRVAPYPREDGRNVHFQMSRLLSEEGVPADRAANMLGLVANYGRVILFALESKMADSVPIFSPHQVPFREVAAHSPWFEAAPGAPGRLVPKKPLREFGQ